MKHITPKTILCTTLITTGLAVAFNLPSPAAPSTLTASDGPDGGHLLSGPLTGVASGPAAFKAGLHKMKPYFQGAKLLGAVYTKDGETTIAAFQATEHGQPVAGLAVASYDPAGHSRFAVLFDEPNHLAQSLPPMVDQLKTITDTALEKDRPAAPAGTHSASDGPDFAGYEAAAKHVPLTRTSFPDGTATIGVAEGFTPVSMTGGQFRATAADGAYANLYYPVGLLDPRGSNYILETRLSGGSPPNIPGQIVIAYDKDPISAWKKLLADSARQRGGQDPDPQVLKSAPMPGAPDSGKIVCGTMTLNGEPYVFSGTLLVGPPPSPEGAWLLQLSIRAAPLAHAAHDMPALIAMQNSEKIDMDAVHDQTMRNIAEISARTSAWLAADHAAAMSTMERTFESSMANAQASQDSINRSSAGVIHYITDQAVVADGPTGAHGTLDAGVADALVKADPERFTIVPVSQYVPGKDY